ncbi:MAG: phage integrase SAM-like domain-containing protein [Bacteroidales bacterium]|nr:site-specific integrase [Lentimicrobiaceae bacterium]MDD5695535.1 phage integrase SAM-like domain-containing protein [Bacteroidales bacterium]
MVTIKPKFRLKEPNSDRPSLILLSVYFDYNRIIYSTGQMIHPDQWDSDNQRVRESDNRAMNKIHEGINIELKKFETKIRQIFTQFELLNVIPTVEEVKEQLDKEFKNKNPHRKIDLVSFIESLIKDSKEGIRLTDEGKKISLYTIKGYGTTLNHLKEFHEKNRYPINFKNINKQFYGQFYQYFLKRNHSTNSIGKHIKNIKVFMGEALKRGLTDNREFREKEFRTIQEDTYQIYLTLEELQKIHNHDFSAIPHLDRVRDIFLIGCFTGLRFGDLAGLRPENIIKDGIQLRIKTQKTGETVVVPLHPIVREILSKYNGKIPRVPTNQVFNRFLKKIGEESEINSTVEVSITKGGLVKKTIRKKYELITVHSARRSFATNGYLMDIPTVSLMKITGHRTEKAFLRYIRISQEDNADKLMNHPFFQPKSNLKII